MDGATGTSRVKHAQNQVLDIQRFLAQPKCIITEVCRFRRHIAYVFNNIFYLRFADGCILKTFLLSRERTTKLGPSSRVEKAPHTGRLQENPWDYQIGRQFRNQLMQLSYLKQPARFVC